LQVIDTHIHCWNFEKAKYEWLKNDTSILNRTYHVDEIEEEKRSAGVTGGVLVQSANNFEDTDWMLEVAENTDWIRGVVGWLPLMNTAETKKVWEQKYSSNKYFKGVRHLIHDEADPKWLLQRDVIESLKVLSANDLRYDIVGVLPAHIETAMEVAHKVPDLKMVFDHLNQPPIATKEMFGVWGELLSQAAKHKNFYVKISGLGTTAKKMDWNEDDVRAYIEFVVNHFGEDRCMCGGDWPVSLLAGSYTKAWSTYKKVIDPLLDDNGKEKIYYENAVKFYKL
jgi:L-fuconolactonase